MKNKTIKLSKAQLRKLIVNEAKKLSESYPGAPSISDNVSDFVTEALERLISENYDTLVNNAFEMMMGTLGDDAPVLARYEDVEDAAHQAMETVLENDSIKDVVQRACSHVLQAAMKPS